MRPLNSCPLTALASEFSFCPSNLQNLNTPRHLFLQPRSKFVAPYTTPRNVLQTQSPRSLSSRHKTIVPSLPSLLPKFPANPRSWDSLYTTELQNHSSDTSDVGTIWFSDSGAEDKVISLLFDKIIEEKILGPEIGLSNCSFLDLGTGNGHFLLRLRGVEEEEEEEDEKWEGRMMGVDYSEKSVEFARRIAGDKGASVEFVKWDIMSEAPEAILDGVQEGGWDVVLDKGTFDAISLSEERDERGRRVCEGYKERVMPLVREGGLVCVTSCNWTGEELRGWFEGDGLEVVGEVGYRSFVFGGEKGQTISSVCFRRVG